MKKKTQRKKKEKLDRLVIQLAPDLQQDIRHIATLAGTDVHAVVNVLLASTILLTLTPKKQGDRPIPNA